MSTVQTTYADGISQAYLGQLVTTEPNNLISREAESVIDFGRVVQQGTADNQVLAAASNTDVVRGFAVRDYSAPTSQFIVNDSVLVMQRGVLWCEAGALCTVGTQAYVVVATGKFTSTVGTNLLVPNAFFDSTAAADGDLVKVRLN